MELLYWLSYRAQRKNLVTNQVAAAGCEKLLQKGGSSFLLCSKICTRCAFYQPKTNLFCNK